MQDYILELLKKRREGYLSGEEVSDSLKITRAAIWKHIQELREQGYEIIAVPHLGYQLVSSPDKLLAQEIRFNLNTKILGKKIYHYESIPSTMDEAFRLGLEGAVEGTIVCAETQTQGRGRMGRVWASPKGKGIYASIILRPSLPPNEVAKLTLLSAVALCEAVRKSYGVPAAIKWPNDIVVNNKKLAGILTELNAEIDRTKFVVVGFGINMNASLESLPPTATSLKMEIGKTCSRVEALQVILRELEKHYSEFKSHGFKLAAQQWRELSVTLGKRIRVSEPGSVVEGEAVNIDEDGGLLVRKDSGVVIKKMAGDIVQLR